MSSSLNFNIRERLAAYLAGEIALHDFEDWFFSATWDVDHVDDAALVDLVYGIKLRLAEFSHGDWTEDQLRSFLRSISEKYIIMPAPVQVLFGTSNVSSRITTSVIYSGLFVDITPLKECA